MVDQIVATPDGPRIVSRGPQSAAGKLFHVGFGLEAAGRYDEAWEAFSKANAMRAADPAEPMTPTRYGLIQAEIVKTQKSIFVKDSLPTLEEPGPRLAPIFIVGMPIAGAPVIEELLGAHPKIQPMGETQLFAAVAAQRFPFRPMIIVRPGQFKRLRTDYQKALRQRGWKGGRFTDRTLWNYLGVGALLMMYPNAIIINAAIWPMETLLECFFSDFVQGHAFAYDQIEIAKEYRRYREIMDHWKGLFPGRIHDVDVYDLSADREGALKAFVTETCKLDWDDACDRALRKLTPLNKDRWRPFAKHFAPMLKALGPYAPK